MRMETKGIRRQFSNMNIGESEHDSHRLPDELIEEILSKIPAKSLLKFKCVSKSWRSLIGSKRFIKAHLENSKRVTHRKVILSTQIPYRTLEYFSLHSVLNEQVTDSFRFDNNSLYATAGRPHVVGICNGLICFLTYSKDLYLWNPCTRMSKKLPDFGLDQTNNGLRRYGFGSYSGDYKVFLSTSRYKDGVFYDPIIEKVYSLKTNSWELVHHYESVLTSQYFGAGRFVSGKLHWPVRLGFKSGWVIRSFDLKNKLYGTVEQPVYTKGFSGSTLGVLEGCLCVICEYPKSHWDIWSLKEYVVKESWNILVRVPLIPNLDHPRKGFFLVPLCVGPNKEILLHYGSVFVVYYPGGNSFRYPKVFNVYNDYFDAEVYVESLVSPDSDGDHQ